MNDPYLLGIAVGSGITIIAAVFFISWIFRLYSRALNCVLGCLLLVSCASAVIPRLQDRTLFIEKGGLYYTYCDDRGFFSRKCKERKKDKYDICNDQPTVDRLVNMGFQCRSIQRYTIPN